jgi:hypothetical protein
MYKKDPTIVHIKIYFVFFFIGSSDCMWPSMDSSSEDISHVQHIHYTCYFNVRTSPYAALWHVHRCMHASLSSLTAPSVCYIP